MNTPQPEINQIWKRKDSDERIIIERILGDILLVKKIAGSQQIETKQIGKQYLQEFYDFQEKIEVVEDDNNNNNNNEGNVKGSFFEKLKRKYEPYYNIKTNFNKYKDGYRKFTYGHPFIVACQKGRNDDIKIFIENRRSIDDTLTKAQFIDQIGHTTDRRPMTGLMAATRAEQVNTVKYLIREGADVNKVYDIESRTLTISVKSNTALMFAVLHNKNNEIAKILLNKMSLQAINYVNRKTSNTALDYAILLSDSNPKKYELIQWLEYKGAIRNPSNIQKIREGKKATEEENKARKEKEAINKFAREIYSATKTKFPYIRETMLNKNAYNVAKNKFQLSYPESYMQIVIKYSCNRLFNTMKKNMEKAESSWVQEYRKELDDYNKEQTSAKVLLSLGKRKRGLLKLTASLKL